MSATQKRKTTDLIAYDDVDTSLAWSLVTTRVDVLIDHRSRGMVMLELQFAPAEPCYTQPGTAQLVLAVEGITEGDTPAEGGVSLRLGCLADVGLLANALTALHEQMVKDDVGATVRYPEVAA